jgi:hypothetical protein
MCIGRHAQLGVGSAKHRGDADVAAFCPHIGFAPRFRVSESVNRCVQPTAREHELKGLGKPDGPGQHGREGKADHHRFHDNVGRHEHAPWREIARQLEGEVGRIRSLGGHR